VFTPIAAVKPMDDTEKQQSLVFWAYMIQWSSALVPPTLGASLIYLLLIRKRVTVAGLRSHVDWQLVSCWGLAAAIGVAVVLWFIAASGVSTDAPISIIATFALVGLASVVPLWILYRVAWGSIRFFKQLPMETLLP